MADYCLCCQKTAINDELCRNRVADAASVSCTIDVCGGRTVLSRVVVVDGRWFNHSVIALLTSCLPWCQFDVELCSDPEQRIAGKHNEGRHSRTRNSIKLARRITKGSA